MVESHTKQVLEKEVTCPLCLDIFKEPKKLPCDHVYCKECLRGLALRSINATISCPECRTLIQLPNNDVNSFPTAFRVNRLIEAFHQVQKRENTKVYNTSNICHVHPTQSLALYCEACKKQLCRDCVLMTQDHVSHKYGFFKEIAPRYRKQLLGELSLIKNQEPPISNALREIAAVENSVASHAEKCQDDIDHAFEKMFSVLQECKQMMKEEAAEHYSSITDIMEHQKEYLEEVQSEIREVASSLNTSIEDDDQSIFSKLESSMIQIKKLKEKLKAVPLTLTNPQVLAIQTVNIETLQCYMKTNCFLYNLADPKMCTVEGAAFLTKAELQVDHRETFTLTLNDSKGKVCQGDSRVEADLVSHHGNSTKGEVEAVSPGYVKVILTPHGRGQHALSVKVNGAHITDSPFAIMVKMPPKLLSQPLTTISRLGRPCGLLYSQGKVLAAEMRKNRIIEIDSQHHVQKLKQLIGITEVTQDLDHNLYATTTTDNKLHKLSNNWRNIKTIGNFGTGNAEFDYPNGLRVSKNLELYVCDSGNYRIQVFDLDLNFKRSFGRKGTGKGQFDFPSDVDFDASGNIYIVDCRNDRIQVFTSSERHIHTIGNQRHCPIKLDHPLSLLMHGHHIYVTNRYKHNVVVISVSGEIIATFGDGYLNYPEGITVDEDGFIHVTSHASRIVVF